LLSCVFYSNKTLKIKALEKALCLFEKFHISIKLRSFVNEKENT